MKGRIVVYSIVGCPHCLAAKHSLAERGLAFTEISVDLFKQSVREELKKKCGKTSVPQIYFNSTYIGGNEQLQAVLKDEDKFNELLKDLETNDPGPDAPRIPDISEATNAEVANLVFTCEADDYSLLVKSIRESNEVIKTNRQALFWTVENSFKGSDLVKWLMKTKQIDEGHAVDIGNELISRHFSRSKSKNLQFKNDSTLYRFVEDDMANALNASTSECAASSASVLGENLRNQILKLYNTFITPDGREVDYKAMAASKQFAEYEWTSAQLQRVDLRSAERNVRLAFFINIYNALVIHATIKSGAPTNMWTRYKFFNQNFYIISGMPFTLQDIENGILRGNKKGVGMLFLPFSKNDTRRNLIVDNGEPKIHFALNCGAKSCPPIKTFSAENINEELKLACESFLEDPSNCSLNIEKKKLTLSKIFDWYKVDFGTTPSNLVKWVCENIGGGKIQEGLKELLNEGAAVSVDFSTYNWTNNAKT